MLGRHAGAQNIDAVEARLLLDLFEPPMPGEVTIGSLDVEVLGHLLSINDRADRHADIGGTLEAGVLPAHLLFHPPQLAFGSNQQVLTLAPALDCETTIAAHDQPLAREHLRRTDFSEVALVE